MTQIKRSIPLEWFVCPISKESLDLSDNFLRSSHFEYCRHPVYKYWDFTPKRIADFEKSEWKVWEHLQENGLISYQADPEHNLGVGNRSDFDQFGKFCSFHGNVLDVGVGPQIIPTHMKNCNQKGIFFVGIDPLEGEQPKSYAYVKGLGEFLPFANRLFDQVLFVTTIDHFIDPLLPLREARRVLKNGGEICIWIGEKDRSAPKPIESAEWYENLSIPEGAEDQFHFKRLTSDQVDDLILLADLKVKKKEVLPVDRWRKNVFYCLTL